jgi:hypothetical protein
MLDTMIHGNHIEGGGTPNVVAYANDVTVILHSPNDIPKVREALRCYEAATAAGLNTRKPKMMGRDTRHSGHTVLQ